MSSRKKSTKKPAATKGGPASPKAIADARKVVEANLKAIAAADQENAKKRDRRAASKDGRTASEAAVDRLAGGKQDHEVPTAKEIANSPKPPAPAKAKRMSALDAAATVLAEVKRPMTSGELIMEMDQRGLWSSPGGKTPSATLYAAIVREINAKGAAARFAKQDRGQFAINGKAA